MCKKSITTFLKWKKCEAAIQRAKLTSDEDDWDENDSKAMNYIYTSILNINNVCVCLVLRKKKGLTEDKLF